MGERQFSDPLTRPSLLVRMRQSQDQEAWRTFVDLYVPLLGRHARRRGMQDADVSDIIQEVLAQVARTIGTFVYVPERGRFRDWLRIVLDHEIGRLVEGGAKECPVGGQAGERLVRAVPARTEDSLWEEEFFCQVGHIALERIRPDFDEATWQAFQGVCLEGRSSADMATDLGKPLLWVYKATFRVRQRFLLEVQYLAEDSPLWAR